MRSLRSVGRLVAVAAVALLAVQAARPRPPLNLVLISIDTLRPDRLGTYGYARATSPAIDAFAADRGVVFENAASVSSWTLPAHVSMLSGVHPTSHGVTLPKIGKIGASTDLLAEMLQRRGYRTLAFTGGAYVGPRYGFARGFDVFDAGEKRPEGSRVGLAASIARAWKALGELPAGPYFLFLHTYDAHCPYAPPARYRDLFRSVDATPADATRCWMVPGEPVTPGQVRFFSDQYDASIRWVDDQIHVLLDLLARRGDLERTVVILTADHGEEFLEHGALGHRNSLHRELLMVPLIVAVPGTAPRRVRSPVSLVDLVPTVLELLALPPSPQVQGESLVPLLARGDDAARRTTGQLAELDLGLRLRSLIDGSFHLIANAKTGERRLFDVRADAAEQHDLGASDVARLDRLTRQLEALRARLPAPAVQVAPDALTPAEIERLQALGYL